MAAQEVSGHVTVGMSGRGEAFYLKYRTVGSRRDGTVGPCQRTKLLGLVWGKKGRPPAGYMTRKGAEDERVRILDAERASLGQVAPAVVTFGQAASEYLRYSQEENECAASTLADYVRLIAVLREAIGDDVPLLSITPQQVEQYKSTVKASGLAARSVNVRLRMLGSIFRRADAKWGTGGYNPASGAAVKRLRETWQGSETRFYRPDEVQRLVAAARTPTHRTLLLTAALTGLRLGELRALRWDDVDLMAQRLQVRRSFCEVSKAEKRPKSGKVRSVPLAVDVQRELARLRDDTEHGAPDDLVFAYFDGTHLPCSEIGQMYKAAQTAAKLPVIRFHDLRHTFGTVCAGAGLPMTTVQAYMGHANIGTTMRYAHFAPAGNEASLISAAFGASTTVADALAVTA